MDQLKGLQSQDGAWSGHRFNDSPRYETRPDLLLDHLQTGAGSRATSIVTEQHSKNKVFNFAEDVVAFHEDPLKESLSPRIRQANRSGMVHGGVEHRVNLHQVEKNKLARLHSASNLVRRVADQALMPHEQDLAKQQPEEARLPQEARVNMIESEQDKDPPLIKTNSKTNQRGDNAVEQSVKQGRWTLMDSAQKSLTIQAHQIGTSAQRSANPNASGISEKISPQKVVKVKELTRLQKSPPASQSKTQVKGEKWIFESGGRSGSSECDSQHRSSRDQSPGGVIQLQNLKRRKSKMSGTMSAFLEDPGQQILDSSLNQSFNLSQTNYQMTGGEMQHNQFLYGPGVKQSNNRENSTDFWKSATSQTSAPISKLQSEKQSQPLEKLESGVPKTDRQQAMTSKKIKPIQMLTSSFQQEHHDRADLHQNRVEPIDQKLPSHHRTQQSMDISPNPFKIEKGQRGTKPSQHSIVVSSVHQPEEQKSCLTERVGKQAAGSSTTSAATQNKEAVPNDRPQLTHRNLHQNQPKNSNVSNQTTGGGSTGSRRSQSSQNDLRSGGQQPYRKHHPSITELGSSQHKTPKNAYFSMSRQLAPSNSSIPPSSCADDKSSDSDVHEYHSMWADISGGLDQTNETNSKMCRDADMGDSYAADAEHDAEYQSYQYLFNKSFCPSNLGQVDQNSSFIGSQSQASQYGQDLDSSFHESATNSNWAKSDRNSYALKSQHSCSTYNKQTPGDKKMNQQSSQSVAQQHAKPVSSTNPVNYGQGYGRRQSTLEETKAANQSPYLHSTVCPANLVTSSVPHDEQISVSSSASSAQKYISQQKAHRAKTSAQVNSQQDLSLATQIQSSGKASLQTPSKDHQTGVESSSPALNHNSGWHAQFGHSGRSGDDGAKIHQAADAARIQMSQSVQPPQSRNQHSHSNQQIANQAVHHLPQSMSARQQPHQTSQSFEAAYPSPSSAGIKSNSGACAANVDSNIGLTGASNQISVSGFTTGSGSAMFKKKQLEGFGGGTNQSQFTSLHQHPSTGSLSDGSANMMMPPVTTMFTPYNAASQGKATSDSSRQNLQAAQSGLSPMVNSFAAYHHNHQPPYFQPQQIMPAQMLPQFAQIGSANASPQQAAFDSSQSFLNYASFQPNMDAYHHAAQMTQSSNPFQAAQTNFDHTTHFPGPHDTQQQSALNQLDKQLEDIQRFYSAQKVPCPQAEFNKFVGQIRAISNVYQRNLAQQKLWFYLQQLLQSSQIAQPNQHHALQQRSGFDHRRDYLHKLHSPAPQSSQQVMHEYSSSSSASKISSSSHHSSVSSQHRSSHQNNLKLALAQAFRDFESIQTAEERTQFLVSKAQLLAKDKGGFQLLKTKIDEEVFQMAQQENVAKQGMSNGTGSKDVREKQPNAKTPQPNQTFVDDLFKQLLSPEYSSFHKLMMHQVANFFCQELFRHASKKQLEQVLELIKSEFCKIAMDVHGTRALQVLLEDELINKEKRTERTSSLIQEALKSGRIFDLSCNIRGNHVLRQCLNLLKTDERRSIVYDPVVQHFAHVARDKHGCQVVKDCITIAQGQWKKDLIRVSFESIEILINDEFGNFVIQAILEHFISLSKRKSKIMDVRVSCVYEFIRQNLAKLCKQQYSSRVVEKAVETMPKDQFEKLCAVYMKNPSKKIKLYKDIMLDNFGNYIAPKVLERAKYHNLQHQLDYFTKIYRDSIEALKKVKHGRQLMGKMNQILGGSKQLKQPASIQASGSQTSVSSAAGQVASSTQASQLQGTVQQSSASTHQNQ